MTDLFDDALEFHPQQELATENVQRQRAIVAVVAVESALPGSQAADHRWHPGPE